MKRITATCLALVFLASAVAQMPVSAGGPTRSSSGQFVIYGEKPGALPPALAQLAANTNYLLLEPALLAVSAERLKLLLARELGAAAPWQGKIYIELQPVVRPDDAPQVGLEKIKGGWLYRVTLPNIIERDRYVLALVHVLLLETANRGARARSTEIPAWLAEGLAREIRASGEMELMLSPPSRSVNGLAIRSQEFNGRWMNPLGQAWDSLRARPALTYEQLSWPTPEQTSGPDAELYRSSAQLFVNRLLCLNNGRAACRTMIETLPQYLNWQLAFQQAFHAYFASPLDVEKWWALQVVQFTGRELTQTWTPEESWRKFDEILHPSVEVRSEKADLPLRTEVSLQTIVREWGRERQKATLQRKLQELDQLRLQVVPDLVALVDDYHNAIQNYLEKRDRSVSVLLFWKRQALVHNRLVEETVNQLDELDGISRALRPASTPAIEPAAQAAVP